MTEYQKAQVESKYRIIQDALEKNNHNKTKAAQALQMDRKTIHNIINKYQLLQKLKEA